MPQVQWRWSVVGRQDVEAAYRSATAAANQAAAAHVRASSRAAQSTERSATARARAEDRWASQAQRAADRAARSTVSAEERRWRAVEATGRRIERELARETAAAERAAAKRAAAEERANRRVAEGRIRTLGRVGERAFQYGVGGAIGVAGLVGAAGRESIRIGEVAQRIATNAGLAGQTVNPAAMKRSLETAAFVTPGVSAVDFGNAALAYQSKTGEVLSTAELQTLGTTAQAGGAQVEDVASMAAALKLKFDLQGEALREALASITVIGARGAFEVKDAAALYDRLASAAGAFGIGKGVGAARTLAGLTQVAREGTGSAEQAATSIERIFGNLADPSKLKSLQAAGVEVFDERGNAKPIQDVLVSAVSKVGGQDLAAKRGQLANIFGLEGVKAINPLLMAFADAVNRGENGTDALRRKLEQASEATDAVAKVQAAAAATQQTATAQWTAALERAKAALGPAVEQALPQLLSALPVVAESFGDLARVIGAIVERLSPGEERSFAGEASKARAAEKAAAEELGGALLTGGSPEEIATLTAKRDAAAATAALAESRAFAPGSKVFGEAMTPSQFRERFAAAGGGGIFSSLLASDAQQLAEGMAGGHGETATQLRGALVSVAGNEEQMRLVERYGSQIAAERAGVQAPATGNEVATAQTGVAAFGLLAAKVAALEAQLGTASTAAADFAKNANALSSAAAPSNL